MPLFINFSLILALAKARFRRTGLDEKMNYNLAFKEVRVGIENAFGRVQLWFPLLGVEKKQWPYDDKLLGTAVEAACKLHNWMMRHRRLSYNAEDNPRNFYREMY